MLSAKAITKRFGKTLAVDGVDLDAAAGELVCLLGPSGCGKSTLLRVIAGLAEADAGAIEIAGADVTRQAANRRPTAMVFQSHALWSHMNVARNIAFGLRVRKLPAAEISRRVDAALELVGLAGYGARLPSQLSGGQAQRVALARCLVVEPKILLMDEPFSALDAHLRSRMRDELRALQRRLGITTIFVTHDQDEAMELADRIVVMNAGRVEQTGAPGELYAAPRTLFVAGFIGLINLLPVKVQGGRLDWLGLTLPADAPAGDYVSAVRPEDLVADDRGAAMLLDRTVDLGALRRHALASVARPEIKLQMTLRGALAGAGGLKVRPARLLLYRDGALAAALTFPEAPSP